MINYFGGPEGAGKTALMTKFARAHHLMGGEVWGFPGYELKNNRGRVVSKLVMPEQIMQRLDDMQYVLLCIDEIQNFMNHHQWRSYFVDIMTYGAAAQRRKREFGILATGPVFDWLPSDFRMMFHLDFECRDCHWQNKELKRGYQIAFTITDRRGVVSGWAGFRTPERLFYPKDIFRYFDTFSLVDPKYQHRRIWVQRDDILVNANGDVIAQDDDSIGQFNNGHKQRNTNIRALKRQQIAKVISQLVEQGHDALELSAIGHAVRNVTSINITDNVLAREYLPELKCTKAGRNNDGRMVYALPERSTDG